MKRFWLPMIAGTLLLAGCQYLSHPFADDRPPVGAPILTIKDSVGVTVQLVAGAPNATSVALSEGIASALRDQEVPATVGGGNHHSYQLSGTATTESAGALDSVHIHWVLQSHDGKDVGSDDEVASISPADWDAGGASLGQVAKAEAPKLAAFIIDPTPNEHKPLQQLFVKDVTGAPGDGNRALPSALGYLFRHRGVPITSDAKQPGTVTVAGTVAVTPIEGQNQDRVQIAWHVLAPDGTDVGQIGQDNTVPHGSLDGRWGEVAMAVAMAGIDDILRVASTVPPARG